MRPDEGAVSKTAHRCWDCVRWFVEWPDDEVGLCQNPASPNYGWYPGQNETCAKFEAQPDADAASRQRMDEADRILREMGL